MSMTKTVSIDARMGDSFRVESQVRNHHLVIDQTKAGGGEDAGPTPLDCLLFSLAGCLASIGRIIAQQRRIELRGLDIHIEGTIDVSKLLGKPTESRTGFQSIQAKVSVDADMTDEEKLAFIHEIDARCPVSENLMNQTPVEVLLAE